MRHLRTLCVLTAFTLALAACASSPSHPNAAAPVPAPEPAPPVTPPPPASTVPTVPPAPPVPVPDNGLGAGDQGPPVLALEQRLDAQHYDVGKVDGVFDDDTTYGVTAFQKVNGMPRTGRATPDVAARLADAQPPAPLVPNGGPTRVEIDLPRQVLFVYENGPLDKILSISTGSGEPYCSLQGCTTAVTPPGKYAVDYHADGWVHSDLGWLYNPVYFDSKKGLAIHGFQDVPADPASHGCVRIPMSAAQWFPDKAPKGTPVYVSDGQTPL